MELRRNLILAAMAVVAYMLFMAWQKDYGTPPAAQAATTAPAQVAAANGDAPSVAVAPASASAPAAPVVAPANAPAVAGQKITVQTDVLNLSIDLAGGDIVGLSLPQYTKAVDSKEAFVLLEKDGQRDYEARSGLIGADGPDADWSKRAVYATGATQYALESGKDSLDVVLSLTQANGAQIDKVFQFKRGSYLVNVSYRITNHGSKPWNGVMETDLKRDGSADPSANNHSFGMSTFLGAAYWSPEKSYNKLAFHKTTFSDGFDNKNVNENIKGGWISMVQHYFITAWIPEKSMQHAVTTTVADGNHIIRSVGSYVTVPPNQTATVSAGFYAGPKLQNVLKEISPGLELTVDYGVLWMIAQPLFWLLTAIHKYIISNWGWSIVLLTVLIKAVFFPLSASSYRSMANMRRVMPQMQRMKEQYGEDRAKYSQAMMELYKKEKINPLGGCLPILVQMPVFMALYWTLMESVELRHATWMWISDLSVMDPIFALPIAMGITMLVQQQLNPAPQDPTQAKVMKMMPIIFTFMFLWFPSGLVLYWFVNNLLSIAQQWVITRQIEKAAAQA